MKRKIFLLFMSLIMLLNVGIGNVYADETGKNIMIPKIKTDKTAQIS
ncbi:hypothetical protein N1236_03960 [Acetivibrio thermocellus]|nr:hypothetical protein [Acetivibrio thermocellus]UWV47674.1 hypothetical protein N1236_03960 [Acetivibrio thermocellus]